jgi:hypothetical protein
VSVYELSVPVSEEDAANLRKVATLRSLPETEALRWSLAVAGYVAEKMAAGRPVLVREPDGTMTRPSFEFSPRAK